MMTNKSIALFISFSLFDKIMDQNRLFYNITDFILQPMQ